MRSLMRPVRLALANVVTSAALAQTAAETLRTRNPLGGLNVIVAIICFVKRKSPVGGWLLWYFFQIYLAGVNTLVTIVPAWKTYTPAGWNNSKQYAWFLASTAPHLVVLTCLIITATALLNTYDWEWVFLTRILLAADLLARMLEWAIDRFYFHESGSMALAGLVFPAIFLPYFFVSVRVKMVFQTRAWDALVRPASFLDPKIRSGVIYTESEKEAIQRRESGNPEE